MANKAKIAKNTKQKLLMRNGNTPFKSVKYRNRCEICGRPRAYIGRFKMCRICFREKAMAGELPGVRKMTW